MSETAADVMVQTVLDWGADTIFGLPGDGINGIIEALRVRKGTPGGVDITKHILSDKVRELV